MIKKPLLQKTFLLITVIPSLFLSTFGASINFGHGYQKSSTPSNLSGSSNSSYVSNAQQESYAPQNEQISSTSERKYLYDIKTNKASYSTSVEKIENKEDGDYGNLSQISDSKSEISFYKKESDNLRKELKSAKKINSGMQAMYQALLKTVNSQSYEILEGYEKLSVKEVKDIWFTNVKSANVYKLFEIQRLKWLGKAAVGFIDNRNRSALHYVIERGNFMLLEELVENIDFADDCDYYLSERLKNYISHNNNNSFKLNKELLICIDFIGYTPMDIAIEKKDYRSFKYLYKQYKQYGVESTTMLHNYSFTDLIKMLDDAKTEVESMNQNSASFTNCIVI